MHIRKLSLESIEKFIGNAEQNNKPSHCFCLAVYPEGQRGIFKKARQRGIGHPKRDQVLQGQLYFLYSKASSVVSCAKCLAWASSWACLCTGD